MPDHPNYSQELDIYTQLRLNENIDFSIMRKELKEKGFTPKDISWIIRSIENSELKILRDKQYRSKAIGLIIGGSGLFVAFIIMAIIAYKPLTGSNSSAIHSYQEIGLIISGILSGFAMLLIGISRLKN